jgi:hypothetical protein
MIEFTEWECEPADIPNVNAGFRKVSVLRVDNIDPPERVIYINTHECKQIVL